MRAHPELDRDAIQAALEFAADTCLSSSLLLRRGSFHSAWEVFVPRTAFGQRMWALHQTVVEEASQRGEPLLKTWEDVAREVRERRGERDHFEEGLVIRTFLDAGVLIAAARGRGLIAVRAHAILDDPERSFVTSDYIRMEVLPKALYHRQNAEVLLYERFFSSKRSPPQAAGLLGQVGTTQTLPASPPPALKRCRFAIYFYLSHSTPPQAAGQPATFRAVQIVAPSPSLMRQAYTEACTFGLSALDAFHIAAAKCSGVEEFITTERPTTPLFRVTGLVITTIVLPS